MQIDLPLDGGSLIALIGFVGAVIFQSAVLKKSVDIVSSRLGRVEEEMSKITSLLISNEAISQKMAALSDRVNHIEDISMALHTSVKPVRRTTKTAN